MSEEGQGKGLIGSILPKTLAGFAVWILLFGMGVGASGVAFFAFYQFQLAEIRQEMRSFTERFDKDFQKRTKEFTQLVKDSKAEIEKASKGVGSQTNEVQKLLEKVAPSIAYVQGTDAAAAPAVASGFIVSSNANESWVVTSFKAVAGSAANKSEVRVRLGSADRQGTVWSWDDRRDLALVILKVGNLKVLEWDPSVPQVGEVVWAVGTSAGKLQAEASQGHILDNSNDGYLVDAGVPTSSSGGALLNRDGKVLGVLSLNYAPEGFPPSNGWVIPIRATCQKVLRCPT